MRIQHHEQAQPRSLTIGMLTAAYAGALIASVSRMQRGEIRTQLITRPNDRHPMQRGYAE